MTIDFNEFNEAILIARCVAVLYVDPLLSSRAMLARIQLVLQKTHAQIAQTSAAEVHVFKRLHLQWLYQKEIADEVRVVHSQTVDQVVGLVGITSTFSLDAFDEVVMVFILSHCFVLSLWGSVNDQSWIRHASSVASVFYCFEVVIRVVAMNGFKNFFNDRRGERYCLQNRSATFLSVVGIAATVIDYSTDDYKALLQVLSACQLWRVFVISPSFRGIAYSFVMGLIPIQIFVLLLLIVMYVYTVIAHAIFGGVTNYDGTMNFDTLEESCLSMYQVFLGSSWYVILDTAVQSTNKALIWFFVSFVMIAGVLFSNLFVGILINTFQYGEAMQGTEQGEVSLALYSTCINYLDEDSISSLLHVLGGMGQMMHFPMWRLRSTRMKQLSFCSKIVADGMTDNLEAWAGRTIMRAIRRQILRKKLLQTFQGLNRIKTQSTLDPTAAITTALDRCGLSTGDSINSTDCLTQVVANISEIFKLTESDRAQINHELEYRLKTHMPLSQRRRELSKQQQREYRGLAKPEASPMDFIALISLIVDMHMRDLLYLRYKTGFQGPGEEEQM